MGRIHLSLHFIYQPFDDDDAHQLNMPVPFAVPSYAIFQLTNHIAAGGKDEATLTVIGKLIDEGIIQVRDLVGVALWCRFAWHLSLVS